MTGDFAGEQRFLTRERDLHSIEGLLVNGISERGGGRSGECLLSGWQKDESTSEPKEQDNEETQEIPFFHRVLLSGRVETKAISK